MLSPLPPLDLGGAIEPLNNLPLKGHPMESLQIRRNLFHSIPNSTYLFGLRCYRMYALL
jgi:hypothetical protein